MSSAIDVLNTWSPAWLAFIGAALWQSTLLFVLIAIVARFLRKTPPAACYWLWQIVAIRLLVIPFWTVSLAVPWPNTIGASSVDVPATVEVVSDSPMENVDHFAVPSSPVSRPARFEPLSWKSWLLVAWSTVVALQIVRLVVERARLSKLVRQAAPADASLLSLVHETSARLGLQRAPWALVTDVSCSPFVCRAARPVLVLPHDLLKTLAPDQLRQVLAHELSHVKRRDLVWGWIPQLARLFYFFHPVAHWTASRIRLERELACDQWAMLASGGAAADYAQTLVQVIGHISRPAALLSAVAPMVDESGTCPSSAIPSPPSTTEGNPSG